MAPLGEREIHLWSASFDIAEWLFPLLSDDERERARRFRFERDRHRFIASRGWLRVLLGRYLQTESAALCFGYGPKGKPYVEGGPHFNLSHSGGMALLAICAEEEVGVDLEAIREIDDAEAIARRHFAPDEIARWLAAPPALRTKVFFDCWTRLEAVAKASGEGLAAALPAGDTWSLFDVSPSPAYAAALAVRGQGWSVRSMGQCGRAAPDSEDHPD
ncbi:Phosphopantetheinyl transferase [Candidatus Sulfopaludibacter sp. SbA4]|nr:Phosphopantetheinyl transferase [Candidatus Sulfopaludibacter sp. SbA4]